MNTGSKDIDTLKVNFRGIEIKADLVYKNRKNASSTQVFDGKVNDSFVIECNDGDSINVTELMNPNDEISYAAYFNKKDCYYSITAIMDKENFTKILKNIYF